MAKAGTFTDKWSARTCRKPNGENLPMCMKSTKSAVRAICATDPSITTQQVKDALAALDGETSARSITNPAPMDRALTRRQVAELLGVSPKTVTSYARQGLLRGVTCGDKRGHVRRYSEASVRELLDCHADFNRPCACAKSSASVSPAIARAVAEASVRRLAETKEGEE